MLDARVWLLWALTTLVVASFARNPLYTILLLLVTTLVGVSYTSEQGRRAPLSPLRFAMVVIPLSALFNALTVHFGETVLFYLPVLIRSGYGDPLLGGPVTLEALAFGATNGLTLTVIFSAFSIFNQVTPVRDLVQLTPRAFHEGGVVLSIALTFIPQTNRALNRIREAQAVRGHRVRGLRDWLPIVLPLLVSGLERSMGLAEAMVARGYGSVSDRAQSLRTQALLALGLLALLGGWLAFLLLPAWKWVGVGAMALGAGLIVGVVWLAGQSVSHTVYRRRRWHAQDTVSVLGCGLALGAALMNRDSLYYSPYPRLTLPPFSPLTGLALLGLVVPAALNAGRQPGYERSFFQDTGCVPDRREDQ
jgi:energy-coupling factor transport system permease protein